MALTLFLSKVLGIALIIMGTAIMVRRRYFIPVFGAFVEERLTRAVVSMIELVAGLFLVLSHTAWSPPPAAIISVFGWMAVIEATAYLLARRSGREIHRHLQYAELVHFRRRARDRHWDLLGGFRIWLAVRDPGRS